MSGCNLPSMWDHTPHLAPPRASSRKDERFGRLNGALYSSVFLYCLIQRTTIRTIWHSNYFKNNLAFNKSSPIVYMDPQMLPVETGTQTRPFILDVVPHSQLVWVMLFLSLRDICPHRTSGCVCGGRKISAFHLQGVVIFMQFAYLIKPTCVSLITCVDTRPLS